MTNFANETTENTSVVTLDVTMKDNGFSPMEISQLPKNYKEEIDEMAVGFYESGRICVLADDKLSSRFLTHQFVSDFSRYSTRIDEDSDMRFVHIDDENLQIFSRAFASSVNNDESTDEDSNDDDDVREENLTHEEESYSKAAKHIKGLISRFKKNDVKENDEDEFPSDYFNINTVDEDSVDIDASDLFNFIFEKVTDDHAIEDSSICVVTDSPTVAQAVSLLKSDAKIIIYGEKEHLVEFLNEGVSEDDNWEVSDADIPLEKNFIEDYLYHNTNKYINEKFKIDFTKEDIRIAINAVEEKVGKSAAYHDGFSVLSPSIWIIITQKIAGNYVLAQNEDLYDDEGKPSLVKVADHFADGKIVSDIVKLNPISYKKSSDLYKILSDKIIGQDEALKQIVDSLKIATNGLTDDQKPLRSFLFAGPTGTGKTEAAKQIAENIADEKMSFLFINMSEYTEKHKVSSLFGAPPGYAGFDENGGGILTKFVKDNPRTVILLDEVEKAHEDIWMAFMSVLDEGKATSSSGDVVDFSKSIIVLTTNTGVESSANAKKISGFQPSNFMDNAEKESKDAFRKEMEKNFKPEFLNRLDGMIIFNNLDEKTGYLIAQKEINTLSERMKRNSDVHIEDFDHSILDIIIEKSQINKYGAREIKRETSKVISHALAEYLETRDNNSSHGIVISVNENKDIVITESIQTK